MRNKGAGITLIILLVIIIVILIGIIVCVITNKNKNYTISLFAFGNKTKILFQNEYSISDIENIVVNSTSSNVKFKEGSSDKAKVTIYGIDGENADATLNGNKLEISKENNKIYILAFFFWAKDEVVVELPKDYDGEVRSNGI